MNNLFSACLLFTVLCFGCRSEADTGRSDQQIDYPIPCYHLDTIEFLRVGKAHYESTGYHPVEKFVIFPYIDAGAISFYQNDTIKVQSRFSPAEMEELTDLLQKIKTEDKNRIYNTPYIRSTEFELRVTCSSEDNNNYVIQSFQQHGDTPVEVQAVFQLLLGKMAQLSFEAYQKQ